jgi:serine phosphatase RsbU (regulator of sigma subunit)
MPINTQQQLNELQTRYQTEKKQQQIEMLQLNANRDRWIKYSLIAVAFLVLISAIMFYSRYKLKEKSNQLLEYQNKIINQKNKDITDSINYANLIQKAFLPQLSEIKQSFNDFFILNLPRDIVSGDFYWYYKKDRHSFLAIADCTGHGVPGAMMSTAGSSLLNQIIVEKNCTEPSEILNQLRSAVINLLKQNTGTTDNKDGMDIALIRFDHGTNDLVFAGANNPLYHVRNGSLQEYKANKQPIGYFSDPKPFSQTVIHIENGDSVYLFTDGYADQFGGPEGKKFKYSQLKNLLVASASYSSEDQKNKMFETYQGWKGNLEQVDDVLLAGIRF